MDNMIEYENVNKLLISRVLTKHIYIYDIYPLKFISPLTWQDGIIMKCLGVSRYIEDDDSNDSNATMLANVIIERLIEISLSYNTFQFYLEDPITLKEELMYYINDSLSISVMYNTDLEYEADMIREYLHYFKTYLSLVTNNTLDSKNNLIDVMDSGVSARYIEDGTFSVIGASMDVSNKSMSTLTVEKYFHIPQLP